MNKDLLGSFFEKLMPLFPPRSEAFLKSATREDLQKVNFRYIFSVNGMVEISHMIEDAIIASPGVSETHVSFQYFSRVAAQQERYTQVAQASTNLWLYGLPDAPLPDFVRTTAIDTTGTPLEHYWFVIAYGPGIHMTLLAEEINAANRLPSDSRMSEGFYTFSPNFTYKIIAVMHKLFPQQIAEPTLPELLG
jgi:DICT domain-containing protein